MTTCTYCPEPATTTGPLGEPPMCYPCTCEDDGTDEWRAEEYARRHNLSDRMLSHYLRFGEWFYEVAYSEGRWTAVDISEFDIPSWGRVIEVTK